MKRYKVVGDRPYAGNDPDEEFEANLSSVEEKRAVKRGSIEVVGDVAEEESGNDESGDDDDVASASKPGGMFG